LRAPYFYPDPKSTEQLRGGVLFFVVPVKIQSEK